MVAAFIKISKRFGEMAIEGFDAVRKGFVRRILLKGNGSEWFPLFAHLTDSALFFYTDSQVPSMLFYLLPYSFPCTFILSLNFAFRIANYHSIPSGSLFLSQLQCPWSQRSMVSMHEFEAVTTPTDPFIAHIVALKFRGSDETVSIALKSAEDQMKWKEELDQRVRGHKIALAFARASSLSNPKA